MEIERILVSTLFTTKQLYKRLNQSTRQNDPNISSELGMANGK